MIVVAKLFTTILCLVSVFAISYFTMIYGWGVNPISTSWVIGSYIAITIVQIIQVAVKP